MLKKILHIKPKITKIGQKDHFRVKIFPREIWFIISWGGGVF